MATQQRQSKRRGKKKNRRASMAADKARAEKHEAMLQRLIEKRRIQAIERRRYVGAATLFGVEGNVRDEVKNLGRQKMETRLAEFGTGFEENSRPCPKCGAMQHFKGNTRRTIRMEYGEFTLNRAYYVCPKCEHGCHPLDEKLGLADGELQGKLREIATMQAMLMPYETASVTLEKIFARSIEPRTLQRLVDREGGEALAADREEERRMSLETAAGGAETQKAVLAEKAPELLYLGVDGIMTPTREASRDAQDQGHREAKVCRIFAAEDRVEISKDRREILEGDMAGRICNASEFRAMVHCRFTKAGGHKAKKAVGLGDGSEWVWNTISEVAPDAEQVLDFMHLMGHINDAATAGYGESNQLRHVFADRMEAALKESRIDHVLAKLEGLRGKTEADRKTIRLTVQYVTKNRSRMDYKRYIAMGYDIGSGTIESTGKRLVGQRLKGCGMRWNRESANAIIALRSRWYTKRWDDLWPGQLSMTA